METFSPDFKNIETIATPHGFTFARIMENYGAIFHHFWADRNPPLEFRGNLEATEFSEKFPLKRGILKFSSLLTIAHTLMTFVLLMKSYYQTKIVVPTRTTLSERSSCSTFAASSPLSYRLVGFSVSGLD